MTSERRAEIESMLDSDRYAFSYGGYIDGLAGDETRDEPAIAIIRELLTAIDTAIARAEAADRVVSVARQVMRYSGGVESPDDAFGDAYDAEILNLSVALDAYDVIRGGSE